MKNFVFVSGNKYKVAMLEKLLGTKIDHHDLDLDEPQSLDAKIIIEAKAKAAYKIIKTPVLVDDVSLHVPAMGGLPNTLVKFFLKSVGTDGICKMVDGFGDRTAIATTTFGYYDGRELRIFAAEVQGMVSPEPRGGTDALAGMGWNSIFIPGDQPGGQNKTLAEMGENVFEDFTPRAKAVQKLKKFLEE